MESTSPSLLALVTGCARDQGQFIEEFVHDHGSRSAGAILWRLGTNMDSRILVIADTEEKSRKILGACAKGLHSLVTRAVFPNLGFEHRRSTYGLALAHFPPGPMSIEVAHPPAYNHPGPVMTSGITCVVIVGNSVDLRDIPTYSDWWRDEVERRLAPNCPIIRFQEM